MAASMATRVAIWLAITCTGAAAVMAGVGCKKNAPSGADVSAVTDGFPVPKVDLPHSKGKSGKAQAVFAGGCFWCTEVVFEMITGVEDVVSGYSGGTAANANYNAVAGGRTKHAEAIQITYDPDKVSYGTLLRVFFASHDPTQLNRQGPDVGPQYRSAVFYASEDEKRVAAAYIEQLNAASVFKKPIVTTLEPLNGFYLAEKYHQDYAKRNPGAGYIRFQAKPKVDKVKKQFPELLDKGSENK